MEFHLLDIVVAECTAILKLFAGEDQALLVGWDAFLVLDLGLDVVDGVAGLDLEGDRLAREGLDEAVASMLECLLFHRLCWCGRHGRVAGWSYICTVGFVSL